MDRSPAEASRVGQIEFSPDDLEQTRRIHTIDAFEPIPQSRGLVDQGCEMCESNVLDRSGVVGMGF